MSRPEQIIPVQQTFLGASIRGWNGDVGWNETPTTLTVNLVEDPRNNDFFDPPFVGRPVQFSFREDPDNPDPQRDFYFAGILNSISEERGSAGNRTLSATLVDPRSFLDGVQLIINDFTKDPGMDNIYNIYSFYEDREYGSARVNNLGMRSDLIRDALDRMVTERPINFAGRNYFLDLFEVPKITEDYRLSETVISLTDYIKSCCDIANMDYRVELQFAAGFGWVIKFRTVSRGFIPIPGAIANFLNSVEDVSSRSLGLEYNYNTRSKFLIGAKIDYSYFQFDSPGTTSGVSRNPEDNERVDNGTISKFWGEDQSGNLIFSRMFPNFTDPDDEAIIVPAYEINFPYYIMTVGELRAATIDQDSWEIYLALNDYEGSIHQDKATRLKIKSELNNDGLRNLLKEREIKNISPMMISDFITKFALNNEEKQYTAAVYNFIRRYATEYFGLKYSISIPNVKVKVDPDDFRKKKTSLIATDSGYLQDGEIFLGISRGIIPDFFNFFQNEEGKMIPYVKFDSFKDINLSYLTRGVDYILDYDVVTNRSGQRSLKESVYVKCQIEEKIYFGNSMLGTDPRVVITLPAAIYDKKRSKSQNFMLTDAWLKSRDLEPRDEEGNEIDFEAEQRKIFWSIVGSDNIIHRSEPYPIKPNMVMVPLRDTLNTYGPWKAGGEAGKVEISQNNDLAPWNFGGVENMNIVGERLVRDVLLQSVESESGSITIPGVFNIGIGAQIPGGGPYINGLNVSIGSDGLTTTYRYGKWQIKTGKMLEYNVNKLKELYKLKRDVVKNTKDYYSGLLKNQQFFPAPIKKDPKQPRRNKPNSSSSMILGQSLREDDSSDKRISQVATMPNYGVGQFINEDFENKSGMSLDGLFRPYEVNGDGLFLPVYELPPKPSESESEEEILRLEEPDSRDLFPFLEGHDVSIVFKGFEPTKKIRNDVFEVIPPPEEPPEGGETEGGDTETPPPEPEEYNEKIRGIAFKGPLVIAGWGFDINGMPVPNESESEPTDNFLEDHLTKYNKWKVGPLDTRWDEERGVWVAGGPSILEGILTSDITAPTSSDSPTEFTIDIKRGESWSTSKTLTCHNRDKSLEVENTGDIFVVVSYINSQWRPIWVGCDNG